MVKHFHERVREEALESLGGLLQAAHAVQPPADGGAGRGVGDLVLALLLLPAPRMGGPRNSCCLAHLIFLTPNCGPCCD